ncbi:MAG: hypothetical protein ACO3CG_05650 [Ilumatobacteraceae bacterium]
MTVGAVGVEATVVVVVVVVVVVEEVGATVVVVFEPAAPPPDELDELVARVARHTVSPMNSGVVSDAELRRNNRAWGTLKRAARRVHESFANTRCVEVHCGEGFTLGETGTAAVFAAAPAPSDETTINMAAIIAMRPTRCLDISLLYAVSNKASKLE